MSNTSKNYKTNGGDTLVIGGDLRIEGGKLLQNGNEIDLTALDAIDLSNYYTKTQSDAKYATITALNGKLTASKVAVQTNSTATDVAGLVSDFNGLLSKLKAAGVMNNS